MADDRARHVREVLKLKVGDDLRVGEINGGIGKAEVLAITETELLLAPGELAQRIDPPLRHLLLALPRPQSLKKVLQSAATLGVESIHLLSAERVEKSYFSSPLLREENILEHLYLGLEQGVSTRLPKVFVLPERKPRKSEKFNQWLEDRFPRGNFLRALAHLSEFETSKSTGDQSKARKVSNCLSDLNITEDPTRPVVYAIGPEGGWTETEVEVFQEYGFQCFSLGPRVLRVETAIVATLAQHDLLCMQTACGRGAV